MDCFVGPEGDVATIYFFQLMPEFVFLLGVDHNESSNEQTVTSH